MSTTPTTPRIVRDASELRPGMRVRRVWGDSREHVETLTLLSPRGPDAATWNTDLTGGYSIFETSIKEGRLYIVSDPPPVPVGPEVRNGVRVGDRFRSPPGFEYVVRAFGDGYTKGQATKWGDVLSRGNDDDCLVQADGSGAVYAFRTAQIVAEWHRLAPSPEVKPVQVEAPSAEHWCRDCGLHHGGEVVVLTRVERGGMRIDLCNLCLLGREAAMAERMEDDDRDNRRGPWRDIVPTLRPWSALRSPIGGWNRREGSR